MTDTRFFVVRTFNGKDHFSIEHGDASVRYSKQDRASIVYRAELAPANNSLSLDQMIEAYKRGVRLKPIPRPPAPPKPKDKNSVKERYLAKLEADLLARANAPQSVDQMNSIRKGHGMKRERALELSVKKVCTRAQMGWILWHAPQKPPLDIEWFWRKIDEIRYEFARLIASEGVATDPQKSLSD